jgi:exodeoxyribonuclease VII large subunit
MSVPLSQTSRSPAPVWTVSQLTSRIRGLLEEELPYVWVGGEISNLGRPTSGHIYFTLKDDRSQIRTVLWRSVRARMKFELSDGMQVIIQGRCSIYEGRSEYQLVVDQLVPKGLGALELAFRQLRERLEKEGLFAQHHKKVAATISSARGIDDEPHGRRGSRHVASDRAALEGDRRIDLAGACAG